MRSADLAQHRASELGEEALDEIEPRAVRGREGESIFHVVHAAKRWLAAHGEQYARLNPIYRRRRSLFPPAAVQGRPCR
jgi:hypothetical protein